VSEESTAEVFLVPHTHWDREWYEPFEGFLKRLVEMMDLLIDLADREPGFRHFHLDGQSALIDDYLAVRPEREADIRRLAKEGRISVGPWFTQMDEFLTSGESHIRNLEWGMARARQFEAEPPVAGYLPDQFGHIGQMPQILRRGGLERAVVWRGVPAAVDKTAFWWEAPDGSRVLTEYLAFGYSIGMSVGQSQDAEALRTSLLQAVEWLRPSSPRRRLLVTVGTDHTLPAAKLAALLEEVNAGNQIHGEIGSLSEFLASEEPTGELPVWRGELRSSARAHLLPGVYSTRAHQKAQRAGVEALVERVAEPLAALVPGFDWPEDRLREIWRRLLWNGAHDSVCGCSVDEVAAAVEARYDQAEEMAMRIVGEAINVLVDRMSGYGQMTFNPSPFERDGVPGLGWRVSAPTPIDYPAEIEIDGDHFHIGDLRFRLVDEGDVGDLYNFDPTAGEPPSTPASMEIDGDALIARWPGLTVELSAFENADADFIRLIATINNERPDHRLRLHVGLLEPAEGSWAMAPFEVVERPLRGEGGSEIPSPTWPARQAAMAGGLAVFGDGVFEYEVHPDGELAVTMLRCVGTISRPQLSTRAWAAGPDIATPDAQMLGEQYFFLAVAPGLRPDELPSMWERINLLGASAQAKRKGDLPDTGCLLEVEGAELSSVRKVDGKVQVRVWNPSKERRVAKVAGRDVPLGPAEIATIEI
jgi:alpha-mannosidase